MKHNYTIIIVGFLILFSIFRRVRGSIGWQQLKSGKMKFRIGIFLIIGSIFLIAGAFHPVSIISDVIGILAGVLLAYYGARKTTFEEREGRWFYRPNPWIGSSVVAIFFARLIYRFYEMYNLLKSGVLAKGQMAAGGLQNLSNNLGSTWTTGLILVMFAYYITYYILLLGKQKHLLMSEIKKSHS